MLSIHNSNFFLFFIAFFKGQLAARTFSFTAYPMDKPVSRASPLTSCEICARLTSLCIRNGGSTRPFAEIQKVENAGDRDVSALFLLQAGATRSCSEASASRLIRIEFDNLKGR